jgi:hypothetical protein
MTPKASIPPDTYTFFEPRNENFFQSIADRYEKLIENNFEDSINTFRMSKMWGEELTTKKMQNKDPFSFVDAYFRNYYEDLPFPACDYYENLRHKGCGHNRLVVLTSTQEEMIVKSVDYALESLEVKPGISKTVISKIRNRCIWLDKTDRIILRKNSQEEGYINYFTTWIKKKILNGAKNITYVRAKENSDFARIEEEIKSVQITPCDAYQ